MPIEMLEDNWKVDLDEEGRILFDQMVLAEHEWCNQFRNAGADTWQHWRIRGREHEEDFRLVDVLTRIPRRVLVAAPVGTPIPNMADMLSARADFRAWLSDQDPRLGGQTTASPGIITPTGSVSAATLDRVPDPAARSATWSRSEAFRSGILTMREAEEFLIEKIEKIEDVRDSAERNRQWDRYRSAEARLAEAEQHLAGLRAIPGKGSDLVARLSTGSGWTIRSKWTDPGIATTPFHIPHVAVLPVNPDFSLTRAPTRKSASRVGERIGDFGRLAIFRIVPN